MWGCRSGKQIKSNQIKPNQIKPNQTIGEWLSRRFLWIALSCSQFFFFVVCVCVCVCVCLCDVNGKRKIWMNGNEKSSHARARAPRINMWVELERVCITKKRERSGSAISHYCQEYLLCFGQQMNGHTDRLYARKPSPSRIFVSVDIAFFFSLPL